MRRKAPISTVFFDLFGIVFWVVAVIATYLEETAGTRAAAAGDGVVSLAFAARQQDQLIIVACAAAIIGTLFLGFSATIKAITRDPAPEWSPEDHIG